MRIIDGLTHVTRSGLWLDGKLDSSTDQLLRQMDAAGVEQAIVTALQGAISDDEVAEACALHPDRLIGFCAPDIGQDDAGQSLNEAKERSFVGVKLHPRFGKFEADSDSVLRCVESAVRLQMPIILCGIAGARGQAKCTPPHQILGQWADLFPDHPFVLAHAGSHRILDAWEMARNRDNVFLDLSHTLHYFRGSSVERDIGFVARRLDRRVLFGSDFPESSITQAIEHLDHYLEPWPDTNRKGILGGNWNSILSRAADIFDKGSDA